MFSKGDQFCSFWNQFCRFAYLIRLGDHFCGRTGQPISLAPDPNNNVCAVQGGRGVQYCGGVQYRGDIMMHVWDILSTVGDVQYHGGYHDKCEGYLEYCGGVQYRGGYHEYHGVILSTIEIVPWGDMRILGPVATLNRSHGFTTLIL